MGTEFSEMEVVAYQMCGVISQSIMTITVMSLVKKLEQLYAYLSLSVDLFSSTFSHVLNCDSEQSVSSTMSANARTRY
jgi:hypothetical protein